MISVKINYQNYRRLTIYGVGLFHWFSPTHWFPVWQYFCIFLGSLWSSRQFDVLLCGFKYSIQKPHTFHTGSTFKTCLPAVVQTLHHFPEGPLTQSVDYFICRKIVKIKYKLNRVFLKSIFQKVLKPTSVLQDISASVDQVTVFSVPLIPAQRLTAAALWTKNHQRRDKTSCNLTFLFICTSKNRTRTQRCT